MILLKCQSQTNSTTIFQVDEILKTIKINCAKLYKEYGIDACYFCPLNHNCSNLDVDIQKLNNDIKELLTSDK